MAARAVWKGFLKIDEISCPVALYAAASTSERVALNMVNRRTGRPLRREYVDVETEEPVDKDAQVKGYEVAKDRYVVLTPQEMATAVPESDKTLCVESFIECLDIDTTYFDKPYYIAPASPEAAPAFALIRDGMRAEKTAALARAVLFRRVRTLLIRPQGDGLIGNTLNFEYEVRPAGEAFQNIPEIRVEAEMLDLAQHIIRTRSGVFDPGAFDDRYDAALAELVRAKAAGRPIPRPAPREEPKPVSLLEALRQSAGQAAPAKETRRGRPKTAAAKDAPGAAEPKQAGKTPARPSGRKSGGSARPTRRAS